MIFNRLSKRVLQICPPPKKKTLTKQNKKPQNPFNILHSTVSIIKKDLFNFELRILYYIYNI